MAKIKTNNNSGTILTTSNTNISSSSSGSLWTTTAGTTTSYTYYNPNIGNQFVYSGPSMNPTPFHINFSWDGKTVDVTLKNGNDIFKLANAFMEWLDKNEIDYSVKTKGKRKKK
jgi:hypothetical protein